MNKNYEENEKHNKIIALYNQTKALHEELSRQFNDKPKGFLKSVVAVLKKKDLADLAQPDI